MIDWKEISHLLTDRHPHAIVPLHPTVPRDKRIIPVNVSTDTQLATFPTATLSPKKVRGFLWEHRNHRALRRPHAIVWSTHNISGNSIVGFGALTSPEAARRLNHSRGNS